MKAVLEINLNELNTSLLERVYSMFRANVTEIVLKPQAITLEEFDNSFSINEITNPLQENGHNAEFIAEIKDGLKNSSIYSGNEN